MLHPVTELFVRVAENRDLPHLLSLENRCFTSDRLSRRSFRHFLRGLHSCCLVAEDGDAPVGYILLLFRRGSSLARVYSLAVDPDRRGRGIARQLLQAGEEHAAARHCLFVRLEVREDNPAAIELYRKAGYRRFDREPDYYDDGEAALRLEKSLAARLSPRPRPSVFYAQTTPFSCGPASLMMAMHRLDPSRCPLTRREELQLWREATTIFMTSGHGGCSPEGLALSAWQRGFAVTLYLQSRDIPFIEGVRDSRKKKVIRLVHEDFVDRIAETDIRVEENAITPAQFQQHIDAGDALLTLISTWRLNRNKAPHWVYISDSDRDFVYVNDPDPDQDEAAAPLHDNIHLPIHREDFERMACFGSNRLKATLVLRRRDLRISDSKTEDPVYPCPN